MTVRLGDAVWSGEIDLPPTGDLDVVLDAPPPRPRLHAVLEKGRLRLRWSAGGTVPEQVQFTPRLSPPAWSDLAVVPQRTGDDWTVELPADESAGFYRLVRE
ncbi:MAG: hypothetical protein D6766_13480 [Verrucomicrobia bacterium]|nr:MAG: hypothetical protein D6766_13480 [Verrucomicrobiota bacterium]